MLTMVAAATIMRFPPVNLDISYCPYPMVSFWLCRRVNQQLSRDIYLPLFIGQLIKIDSHNFRLCRDQLIQVLRLIGYTFQPSSDCTVKRVHYDDVIMTTTATQITSLTVVYSIVYSGADQRKHQSSASLAFVRGIHHHINDELLLQDIHESQFQCEFKFRFDKMMTFYGIRYSCAQARHFMSMGELITYAL